MKSLIVFGAGHNGAQLAKMLNNPAINHSLGDLQIKYFTCNTREKWGGYYCGLPVVSPVEMLKHLDEVHGICVSTPANVDDIMKQLLDMGVTKPVYLTPSYVYEYLWGPDMPPLVEMDITKPRMPYLSICITRNCNLKCKGCCTFSNIFNGQNYVDIEYFEKALIKIKELFSGVKVLELYGGETLLHHKLAQFVSLTRKYLPDSEINILTNGLLIPQITDELKSVMRKQNAAFSITLYPETGKVKKKIEQVLQKAEIKYGFSEPVYSFRKLIDLKGDCCAEKVYRACKKCVTLYNDSLACSLPLWTESLREEFAITFEEDFKERCINLFQTNKNGWQINEIFGKASPMCSYCSPYMGIKDAEFPWVCNHTKAEASDWILE